MQPVKLSVYIAGRVARRTELTQYAEQLISMGQGAIAITSNWLYNDRGGIHANRGDLRREDRALIASADLHDIRKADVVLLFTEVPGQGGHGNGRLVEYGYALGRNKECWVVGCLENLFTCLSGVRHFETWEEALAYAQTQIKAPSYHHNAASRAREGKSGGRGALDTLR